MSTPVLYRDDLETIAPDEAQTHAKIVELMIDGMNLVRGQHPEGDGKPVRISHAKAHGFLKGEFTVEGNLPPELAQGLFARPATYPVVVRISHAPGELLDDSKVGTSRGIGIKIFGVEGEHIPPFADITTQDFVFETGGPEFITGNAASFLQAFKPNAELAPRLPETAKGVVSDVARATNAVLKMFGVSSAKLEFYGYEQLHPLADVYHSQTPYRYGDHVAKFAVVPSTPELRALVREKFDPRTPNALREATVEFFRREPAEFEFQVQLNVDPDKMPIEDATAEWSEEESPYRPVARLVLPVQDAYDPARQEFVDKSLSFSPAHCLAAHRPLGSVNRARLVVYTALSSLRRHQQGRPNVEPTGIEAVPA